MPRNASGASGVRVAGRRQPGGTRGPAGCGGAPAGLGSPESSCGVHEAPTGSEAVGWRRCRSAPESHAPRAGRRCGRCGAQWLAPARPLLGRGPQADRVAAEGDSGWSVGRVAASALGGVLAALRCRLQGIGWRRGVTRRGCPSRLMGRADGSALGGRAEASAWRVSALRIASARSRSWRPQGSMETKLKLVLSQGRAPTRRCGMRCMHAAAAPCHYRRFALVCLPWRWCPPTSSLCGSALRGCARAAGTGSSGRTSGRRSARPSTPPFSLGSAPMSGWCFSPPDARRRRRAPTPPRADPAGHRRRPRRTMFSPVRQVCRRRFMALGRAPLDTALGGGRPLLGVAGDRALHVPCLCRGV